MSVPDETLTLYLTRDGDRWALSGAQRGGGFKPLRPADDVLELDRFADGPAELLERIGQALDAREVERLGDRAELTPQDREALADVAAVLKVLEDATQPYGDGVTVRYAACFARLGEERLGEERTARALEVAERDGVVERATKSGLTLWRLAPAAREETGR
jgi:hypothetical protein